MEELPNLTLFWDLFSKLFLLLTLIPHQNIPQKPLAKPTLLPLTKRTWATPCESRRMMPIWDGVMPFLPSFLICSLTSSAFSFSQDGTERRYGSADWEIPFPGACIRPMVAGGLVYTRWTLPTKEILFGNASKTRANVLTFHGKKSERAVKVVGAPGVDIKAEGIRKVAVKRCRSSGVGRKFF